MTEMPERWPCGYVADMERRPREACRLPVGHAGGHDPKAGLRIRPGDQVLPDGDESLVDDQQILIDEIVQRRKLGIERYGQGHRPFNGRDTLQDLFEEQLDFMVYLTSIRRMASATREDLVEIVHDLLADMWPSAAGGSDLIHQVFAEQVVDRVMGWVAAQIMEQNA